MEFPHSLSVLCLTVYKCVLIEICHIFQSEIFQILLLVMKGENIQLIYDSHCTS